MTFNVQPQSGYGDVIELREFFLHNVSRTGKKLNSTGAIPVEELAVGSTLCAGKPIKKYSELLNERYDMGGHNRTTLSECELIAKIRHPNIVQFLGWCIINGYLVLVMEKLDFSLELVLETYSNLSLPLIFRILKDVTTGLVYLHGKKPAIIHCDLTARNILIDKASMRAKIGNLRNAIVADDSDSPSDVPLVPKTPSCMPPEVLISKPKYDVTLDMFSYGHLALYAVIQKSPGDLLHTTYRDPQTRKLKVRSEVERRNKYIKLLVTRLTNDHTVTKMILNCLDNLPEKRPTAAEALQQVLSVCNDASKEIDLLEFISKQQFGGFLNHRIKELKDGVPGVLDIYKSQGKLRLGQKQDWRRHIFQIKDGFLKYFTKFSMDKSQGELDITSARVTAFVSPSLEDSTTVFCFEVHPIGSKKSPWILRGHTENERTCWMEAIKPGSSVAMTSISFMSGSHGIKGPKAAEQDSAHKSVSQDPPSPTPSYYTVDTSTWHRVSMPANNDGQSTSKSGPYAKLINPSSSLGGEYTKLLRTNSRKVQQDISAEPQVQVEKTISGMPPPATASETYDESIHNTRDHKDTAAVPYSDIELSGEPQLQASEYLTPTDSFKQKEPSVISPPPLPPKHEATYTDTRSVKDIVKYSPPSFQCHTQQSTFQVPFFHHKVLECDSFGQDYTIRDHDITLRVPKGAIPAGEKVQLEIAVAMDGPFEFVRNAQPISPILWLCLKDKHTISKQFQVILPHFLTGLTQDRAKYHRVQFAKANHNEFSIVDGQKKYCFVPIDDKPIFTSSERRSFGVLLTNHCCFLCLQADYTNELATDAGYCLARIESFIEQRRSEIQFSVVYCLPTCLKALEQQVEHKQGYRITSYNDFKFKDDKLDPHIKIIPFEDNQLVVALDPTMARIRAEDINFWRKGKPLMQLKHERSMYPPRVKMTVVMKDPNSILKLPIRIEGCSMDSQLDTELTFPLGFSSLNSSTPSTSGSQTEPQSHKIICMKPRLKESFREMLPLAAEWRIIGTQLEIEKHILDQIKAEEQGVRNCLHEMLSQWIRKIDPPPTWSALADAVETVDEIKANEIRTRCVDV